jgi:type I restriction enzyme S subunit
MKPHPVNPVHPVKTPWPTVRLGEVLRHYQEYIEAPEPRMYPKLSVKLYGKGVVLDAPADGMTLKMKRHQLAKIGQVVLSEIWGKKGAIGFVPPEGEGALCTSHFFLFYVCEDKLDRRWLQAIFAANYLQDQLDAEAKGTTGYAAVRPKILLACEIPLPPLAEQRRVVARIEELAAQIQEARTLRRQAAEEAEALLRSIITDDKQARLTPMRELVKLRSPDVTARTDETYQFAGVYCFGRGVFKAARKSGMDFAYPRLTRLCAGEFVYPKLMAWEGALGVVPPECDGCVVSTEFPVFEVNEDRVLNEVLDIYFRTPSVWPEIAGESTGTNIRRRRLNPQDFLDYEMPLPSRETQMTLRKVKAEVDTLKRLQAGTAAELDALLPAILDRAFKGEL